MNRKILVVAPTRPLVEQHRKTFLEFLKIGEDEMRVVTGKTKPEQRMDEYRKADIVFATPQTISNDIKSGIIKLGDFQLLVVDEAHHAVGSYAYTFIARRFREIKGARIIGFTASPSSKRERIDEIKSALGIKIVEVRDEADNDVKGYVKDIESDYEYVELPVPFQAIRAYLESIILDRAKRLKKFRFVERERPTRYELILLQSRLAKMRTGIGYAGMSYVAEMLKLEHAILLLETQSLEATKKYLASLYAEAREGKTKASKRIVSEFAFQKAYELCNSLLDEGMEHPKLAKLEELLSGENGKVIVFTQYRLTASIIGKRLSRIMPVSIFIGQNKGMKQDEQRQVLERFRSGELRGIVATSIGEEGLDIPEVDVVVFYEPVPSEIRFVQRRGRTGRKKSGKMITLITKGTRDESYHWSTYNKRKKMKRMLKGMSSKGLYRWS